MARILTPFGKIHIRRDERETLYQFEKQEFPESADVFKRKYKIRLTHIPDGKEHKIECFFQKRKSLKYEHSDKTVEALTGERFFSGEKKLFIGVTADASDYGHEHLENGMAYTIHPKTKNTVYEFDVWWTGECKAEDKR